MDPAIDRYPSRIQGAGSFGDRLDPVVHGTRIGPLGADDLAEFESRGFLVRREVFDAAHVRTFVAEAERMAATADPSRDDVVVEPGSDVVRSVFRPHRSTGALGTLARDPRLLGVVRQLLGSDVYIHQSRLNFKPPFEGKAFPWHSDFETWHAEDGMPAMRAVSVSLLLTLNTEHNGPLMVIPGSHRIHVRCPGETPENHFKQSLRDQQYGVPDRASLTMLVERGGIASITGAPGTLVFFDCNLMHGSAGNITPLPRSNLFLVYNSTENALVAPFCGRAPRPEFLAERDFTALPS